jgi:mannitol-specific phosphotransferase system IIBC component
LCPTVVVERSQAVAYIKDLSLCLYFLLASIHFHFLVSSLLLANSRWRHKHKVQWQVELMKTSKEKERNEKSHNLEESKVSELSENSCCL